jgi:hypothetical protein
VTRKRNTFSFIYDDDERTDIAPLVSKFVSLDHDMNLSMQTERLACSTGMQGPFTEGAKPVIYVPAAMCQTSLQWRATPIKVL